MVLALSVPLEDAIAAIMPPVPTAIPSSGSSVTLRSRRPKDTPIDSIPSPLKVRAIGAAAPRMLVR